MYGTPTYFVTFAPDDVHTFLSIRSATSADNISIDKLGTSNHTLLENIINKMISETELKRLATSNPVATSRIYHRIKYLVYNYIFGMNIEGDGHLKTRKSNTVESRPKGAFGKILAAAGTDETSGRLALHTHIILFTVMPDLYLAASACEEITNNIAEGLNVILKNELSPKEWVQITRRREKVKADNKERKAKVDNALESARFVLHGKSSSSHKTNSFSNSNNYSSNSSNSNSNVFLPVGSEIPIIGKEIETPSVEPFKLPEPIIRGALAMSPKPSILLPEENPKFTERYETTVALTAIHTHSFACKKMPHGKKGCRFCFPQAVICSTVPVWLDPMTIAELKENDLIPEDSKTDKQQFPFHVRPSNEIEPIQPYFSINEYGKNAENPHKPLDDRVLVWEMQSSPMLMYKNLNNEEKDEYNEMNDVNNDVNNVDDSTSYRIISDDRKVFNSRELDKVNAHANYILYIIYYILYIIYYILYIIYYYIYYIYIYYYIIYILLYYIYYYIIYNISSSLILSHPLSSSLILSHPLSSSLILSHPL
jgi:hypothetical protein